MAVRQVAVSGRADPRLVWERFASFELWPRWSPQIRSVESADRQLRLGAAGHVTSIIGVGVDFTVTELDAPSRTWSWIVRLGPVAVTMHHAVEEHIHGSRVRMILDGPGWVITPYAALMIPALRRLVRRRPDDR